MQKRIWELHKILFCQTKINSPISSKVQEKQSPIQELHSPDTKLSFFRATFKILKKSKSAILRKKEEFKVGIKYF
jgi:hypothetical protein